MVQLGDSGPTYCIEKHNSNGIVRAHNHLPFLYLHSSVKGIQQVACLHILVDWVFPQLEHGLGAINRKEDNVSFPLVPLWG